MSSPEFSSPLAEALANDDIAFSFPEALRALPIGSSWPPRPEVLSPSPYEKCRSKLLPGERDSQPAFRLPTSQTQQAEVTSQRLSRRHDASVGGSPSRCHDTAALCSPTKESSRVVAGPSRLHNVAVEESKQLAPALQSQPKQVDGMGIGSYGQGPAQDLAQEDAQPAPKKGGKGKENMESIKSQSTSDLDLNDLHPLHRGPSWPDFNPPPSSPSSSGSWVTARWEEFKEAEWE